MNDPFNIEKAVRFPNNADKLRAAGRGLKGKANSAYGNATSKPGQRNASGETFGTPLKPRGNHKRAYNREMSVKAGAIAGAVTGAAIGTTAHYGQSSHDRKTHKEFLSERQKAKVKKAFKPTRAHRITDLGSKGNSDSWSNNKGKRWPLLAPGSAAAGAAGGGALTYANAKWERQAARGNLERKYKTKRNQEALKEIKKANVALERYTPTKSERRKDRGKDAAYGAAVGAGAGAAHIAGNHAATAYLKRKNIPVAPAIKIKSKKTAVATGALTAGTALLSAGGSRDKEQYRVVKKSGTSAFGVDHG